MFLYSKANENAMYFVFKNRLLFVCCFFSQLFVPCVLPQYRSNIYLLTYLYFLRLCGHLLNKIVTLHYITLTLILF